jgi:hypothetical protein
VQVISSYSNFMAHSLARNGNNISFGIMGNVTAVPADYHMETVIVVSSGVNQAMEDWGDILLRRYGKDRHGASRELLCPIRSR